MRCAKALLFLSISCASFAILNGQLLRVLSSIGKDIFNIPAASRPKPSCAANEVWTECYGSNCPGKSCFDLSPKSPKRDCWKDCNQGCICAEGFYRRGNAERPFGGPCIAKDECKTVSYGFRTKYNCSSTNEVWSECFGGKCPGKACEDLSIAYRMCYKICDQGCICADGLYRRGEYGRPFAGPCISKDECKADNGYRHKVSCGSNEVWSECFGGGCPGSACEDLWRASPRTCFADCNQGCICADGFYRKGTPGRPYAGPCIAKAACAAGREQWEWTQVLASCGTNEKWNNCHSGSCPGASCSGYERPFNISRCFDDCTSGCVCADGFFRKGAPGSPYAGTCVPRSECPPAGEKLSFKIEVEAKIPKGMKASKNTK